MISAEDINSALRGRRVLLTGATGFIGTHLARALEKIGAEIHAIRRQPDAGTRLPCRVHWHLADLLDPKALKAVVAEVRPELAYHLAAHGTIFAQQEQDVMFRVNVEGSLNVWNALDAHPCRVVMTGTAIEYGNVADRVTESHVCQPTSFYGASKHAAYVLLSSMARQSGREFVTLRPFGPYGPADDPTRVLIHVIVSLLRGEEVRVTMAEQRRDYSHVADHVQALLRAGVAKLPHTGVAYNIGSGKVMLLRELIHAAAEAVSPEARKLVKFGAVPYRSNEVWDMCCDITAARRDLGYEPITDIKSGLQETADWFRRNY